LFTVDARVETTCGKADVESEKLEMAS